MPESVICCRESTLVFIVPILHPSDSPAVNIIEYLLCTGIGVAVFNIFDNPCY